MSKMGVGEEKVSFPSLIPSVGFVHIVEMKECKREKNFSVPE